MNIIYYFNFDYREKITYRNLQRNTLAQVHVVNSLELNHPKPPPPTPTPISKPQQLNLNHYEYQKNSVTVDGLHLQIRHLRQIQIHQIRGQPIADSYNVACILIYFQTDDVCVVDVSIRSFEDTG